MANPTPETNRTKKQGTVPQKTACPFCRTNLWFRRTTECRKCGRHLRRLDGGSVIAYATHDEFAQAAERVFKQHTASMRRLADSDV
jgi:ribosomal protein L37AE/L43A